jgi:hypothetical protein
LNCTLYTDANGTIYIKFLDEEGDYRLQETEAPEGYELDDTVYDIVIQGGYTTRIDLVNYLLPVPDDSEPMPVIIPDDLTPDISASVTPSTPTDSTVDIPDEDTPLAPAPDSSISDEVIDDIIDEVIEEINEETVPLVPIMEDEVPLTSVPQTGTRSSLPAAVLSAAVAALLLKKRRRAK